jgi:mRNA-degrading endonuclease YafQ of YafQ-DinJ toxin-antitoxin module
MKLAQKPSFKRVYKRLFANQKQAVDNALSAVIQNPMLGKQKRGDLSGMFIYKFDCVNQEYLLAYQWDEASRTFIALGVHENFYRDLKGL